MNCPKCNHDNPDDAKICELCSYDLTTSQATKSLKIPKNKMIILSVLFAGISSVLIISIKPTLAFIAASLCFLSTIASIQKELKLKSVKKIKPIAKVFIVIMLSFSSFQMLIQSYSRIDTPPIPYDYTIKDIKSASPKYNRSYELLRSLNPNNDELPRGYTIGLSVEDVNNLEKIDKIFSEYDFDIIPSKLKEKENEILTLWDKAQKARELFTQLDTFPEIADLSEPILADRSLYLRDSKSLTILYKEYICLQLCKGNYEKALNEYVTIDSVFKKISLNARNVISKLISISCSGWDIRTANFIINYPETPNEVLFTLKEKIESFSDSHTSFKNPVIFEYLTYKNIMKNLLKEPRVKYSVISPFKYNSALRLERNFLEKWLAIEENREISKPLRVWPKLYPNLPSFQKEQNNEPQLTWYYRIYNPFTFALFNVLRPNLDKVFEIKTRFKMDSDMLKIILNQRLGNKSNFTTFYDREKYIFDIEKKRIYTIVSDGEEFELSINPEVLHLSE